MALAHGRGMAGVISPSSASATTMPMGPTMISALRQFTTTAFSPVAARGAPALRMAFAARLLVPTAVSRASGHCVLKAATSCLPSPRPARR